MLSFTYFLALPFSLSVSQYFLQVDKVYNGRTDLEYEDLNKLVYLEQCIRETLRIYSVAQDTHRESLDSVTIDGLTVPKGNLFCIVCKQFTEM